MPCLRRADALPADGGIAAGVGNDDEDELEDDWIAPRGQASDGAEEVAGEIGDESDEALVTSSVVGSAAVGGGGSVATADEPGNVDDDDDDDVPDMDDFDDDNIVEDVAALTVGAGTASASSGTGAATAATPNQGAGTTTNVLKTRTYDLSITYDKYYQTPRMWLIGYDEQNSKLEPVRCLEDVSHEHARKTVTIDEHPCLDVMAASIHPCKHANVMKRITDMMVEGAAPAHPLDARAEQRRGAREGERV